MNYYKVLGVTLCGIGGGIIGYYGLFPGIIGETILLVGISVSLLKV